MSGNVPRELMVLLERLGLADAGAIRAVEGRVRRLGRDLPQFQPIWVDALAQARVLSPYQAAEINAGRGEDLRLGPYVLKAKLSSLGYARRYAVRHVQSGDRVELLVVEGLSDDRLEDAIESLASVTKRASELNADGLAPAIECGREAGRAWIAMPRVSCQTATDHVVRHGRMPPEVVLEIARQMVAALTHLERVGLAHGDVSATTAVLTEQGRAVLLAPGLRPIVRSAEGFAHTDLAPEYYDSTAPEQIDGGAPPDALTDLYGCGCLWWHLLTGRSCFAGGDSLGKLRAHLTDEAVHVRGLAPDAPTDLAAAIESCVARDREKRPGSAAELVKRLGQSTPAGRSELARWVKPSGGSAPIHVPSSRRRATKRAAWPMAAVGAALIGFIALLWAIGLPSRSGNGSRDVASQQSPATVPENPKQEAPSVEPTNQKPDQPVTTPPEGANEIVLSAAGPVTLDPSKLADGVRVSGPPGGRATVLVRGSPITVSNEDVLFDGIDFVWQAGTIARPDSEPSAILQVESGRIRFRRCTFQTAAGQADDCAALRWVFPVDRSGLTLPTGKLSLDDCVFARVDGAVDARTAAAWTIECKNILHLGPGPLVRLDHAPPADEPLGLALKNVTLRQAGSVLEIHDRGTVDKPGTISINAQLCIFDPRAGGALLSFVGSTTPEAIAKAVYWTGEGALVTPEANIAQWCKSSGARTELNDAAFSIAGLVRSRVEFAGRAEPAIASNVAQRWQAPLPTADAPGIRGGALPQPVE
jgi:eukaryotic-like serine/threonine-protein kinase